MEVPCHNPPNPVRRDYGAQPSGSTWSNVHWKEMNIESGRRWQDGPVDPIELEQRNEGIRYEVANAGTLWDIYDSVVDNQDGDACDDALMDGFDNTWQSTAGHGVDRVHTIADFYKVLHDRFFIGDATREELLTRVFCEHGMEAVCVGGNLLLSGVSAGVCGLLDVLGGVSEGGIGLAATPNPAREGVVVSFGVPGGVGSDRVRLRLFDITGRMVRTLVDEPRAPGQYRVFWDGRDAEGNLVRAGVYVMRLNGPGVDRKVSVVTLR